VRKLELRGPASELKHFHLDRAIVRLIVASVGTVELQEYVSAVDNLVCEIERKEVTHMVRQKFVEAGLHARLSSARAGDHRSSHTCQDVSGSSMVSF
jgi:hypothetical protein